MKMLLLKGVITSFMICITIAACSRALHGEPCKPNFIIMLMDDVSKWR